MADCNAECIRNYTDGIVTLPPAGAVQSPFVEAELFDGSRKITVGNESAPAQNSAIIKSFQYSFTDGAGCTLEILDEEGGDFQKFFDKISHGKQDALKQYGIKVRWGWIVIDEMGNPISTGQHVSGTHHFAITGINIKYEAKIVFVLSCTDLMQITYETRQVKTYGTQDQKMALKDAIRQLCRDNVVPIKNVRFLRKDSRGEVESGEWNFKGDPVKSVWEAKGQHVLDTIKQWIQPHTTDRGKGVIVTWDDTAAEPTLILWEDPAPLPGQTISSSVLRAYVVNGGACSSVISFNHEVKFTPGMFATAGGFVDNTTGYVNLESDNKDIQDAPDNVGISVTNQISRNAKDVFGTDADKETQNGVRQHSRANINYGTGGIYSAINGELRVIGDPKLDNIYELVGQYIGIAVVNPFNLTTVGDRTDWKVSGGSALADSSCNRVLSNKRWMIQGVAHDMREGSYITSIKVSLPNPDPDNQPMGGDPNGYKFGSA